MKLKVLVGSLKFEDGTFQKGDIIEVTSERAALFDKHDIEIISEVVVVEDKPQPKTRRKAIVSEVTETV
jgi:hypothetical protein